MKTAQEYQKRLQRHLDELKWLYCELYPGREDMFTQLCEQMEAWYQERPEQKRSWTGSENRSLHGTAARICLA